MRYDLEKRNFTLEDREKIKKDLYDLYQYSIDIFPKKRKEKVVIKYSQKELSLGIQMLANVNKDSISEEFLQESKEEILSILEIFSNIFPSEEFVNLKESQKFYDLCDANFI